MKVLVRLLFILCPSVLTYFFCLGFHASFGPRTALLSCLLAVVLSSVIGGFASGLAATATCLFFALFTNSQDAIQGPLLLGWAEFILLALTGVIVSLMGRSLHKAKHQRAELTLREQSNVRIFKDAEERFHSALTAAHAGIYRLDLKPGTAFRNASLNKIFGLDEEEGVYPISDFMQRIHIDDQARVNQSIQRMLQEKSSFSERYRVYSADGSIMWIKDRGRVLTDEEGQVAVITGTMVDISDLVQTEESLHHSQEQFRVLIESIKDYGIFLLDTRGNIVSWNVGAERITGFTDIEAIGKHHSVIFATMQYAEDSTRAELAEASEKGNWQGERWHTRKNGDQFLAQEIIYPLQREGTIYGFAKVIGDITLRKRAEDALKHSEARFRQLLEAIPQMVWSARPDFSFDYANRRWLDYTGMSQAEIAKEGWSKLFEPEDAEQVMEMWKEASHNKSVFSHEVRIRRGDGSYRWHLCRALPILNVYGEISEWFGTHTDIEEQKQTQSELLTAKQEAEEASQLKSAFLATVSHEIRTPLSAIIGFSLLLTEETWQEDKMREFAHIALRNGYALARIIDDILDLSKVEAGKLEIVKTEISVHETLSEVLESLSVKARGKGIGVNLKVDDNVPNTVASDPTRLRQILVNIIGNAIKFTDQGEVCVTVVREGRKGDSLAIYVKDTGCGISSQNANFLFQAFVQADTSTSRKYGGTGLGLALSRKLAQLLGGNVILVDSRAEEGSTFKIHLPITPLSHAARLVQGSHKKADNPTRIWPSTGRLKGLKILVAEDALDTQLLIRQILQKQGAEIDFASNGLQAIQCAQAKDYDIVLMDIQMPVCDGYQATRTLRADAYDRPIVGLSAHAMREEQEKIIACGCNAHLAKPFDPKRLVELIENLVFPQNFDQAGEAGSDGGQS